MLSQSYPDRYANSTGNLTISAWINLKGNNSGNVRQGIVTLSDGLVNAQAEIRIDDALSNIQAISFLESSSPAVITSVKFDDWIFE